MKIIVDVKLPFGMLYMEVVHSRAGVLEHLKGLISLDLGQNKISKLEPQVFIANNRLQTLVLDSNFVSIAVKI